MGLFELSATVAIDLEGAKDDTHMICPKSPNLLPSFLGAPAIPLSFNPPGGPILLAPTPARDPEAPIEPGALGGIAMEPRLGRAPPALRAARLSGPDAGPGSPEEPPPPLVPSACERRRAPMEVALGLGPNPECGDGAEAREAAT